MAESLQEALTNTALLEVGAVGLGTAKKELREKIARLREQMMSALTSQFEVELDRSLARLNAGMAPYSRFVRAEQQALAERQKELATARDAFLQLKEEIEAWRAVGTRETEAPRSN